MRNLFKNRIVTVLILLATLVLAGVAIFTAYRLYQLRQQAVAPTAPESVPQAAPPQSCTALSFTISAEEPSPTPTPTGSPTASPTATPTASPTATPTATATATASPTPTPELPDAGTSYPTIIGIGVGILLILGSLLLAL